MEPEGLRDIGPGLRCVSAAMTDSAGPVGMILTMWQGFGMNRRRSGSGLAVFGAVAAWLAVFPGTVVSEEPPAAGRPWLVVCLASLDQLQNNLDAALFAADRPELADLLAAQVRQWRNLAGIDRKRPLGLVRFWPTTPEGMGEEILFLPATNREELLKTMTFGVVGYTRRTADHYVIARPEIPYHVLFRKDVAWLGDRTATLITCSQQAPEWLGMLVAQHDAGVMWDVRQIPAAHRRLAADAWRLAVQPALQQRDGEAAEHHAWRRRCLEPLVEAGPLAIEQTRRILLRVKFDVERSQVLLDWHLVAEPQSEWSRRLESWRPARSPWQHLLTVDEARSAGFVTGLPAVGNTPATAAFDGQLAWQVFGELLTERTAVLAWSDGPVAQPQTSLADLRRPRVYQQVPVPDVPIALRRWIGGNTQAWRWQEGRITWWAFGPPDLARKRLDAALELVQQPADLTRPPAHFTAKVPLRLCLDAIPWLDQLWLDEQLAGREDRITITLSPVPEGVHMRWELPTGILRVLGGILAHELSLHADWLLSPQTENSLGP
jgi:hypothetical protein